MKPSTTGPQSGSNYGSKFSRSGSQSNPYTNETTDTGHPIGEYLVPANPNLPNVQQVVSNPSHGRPPTLPPSGTGPTALQPSSSGPRIPHGLPRPERLHQAVPQTVPYQGYAYEIPPDSPSNPDNDDVESNVFGPFERTYRAPSYDKVFERNPYVPPSLGHISTPALSQGNQFAGSALPSRLVHLHESTMRPSGYPSLPAGYGNPPSQQYYNHNVIGLPPEPFPQAPLPSMQYYQRWSLNPGVPYSGLHELQLPQSQPNITPTQRSTNFINAGDNPRKPTFREELYNSGPKLFSTLVKFDSINDRVQIVESCKNNNDAQDLLAIALRNWGKQGSRPSLMLCLLFLLTPFNPDEQFVRQFIPIFEANPPARRLPSELKWLWSQCLARRNEIDAKIPDPTLRNKVFELIGNHFGY